LSPKDYESHAKEYTYWIEHAETSEEYHQYHSEFTYFTEHYSEHHQSETIWAVPVNTKWETTTVVHNGIGHEAEHHDHSDHQDNQDIEHHFADHHHDHHNADHHFADNHHEVHEPTVVGGNTNTHVEDWGIVCFSKNSDAAKKLIASGAQSVDVETADFEVHCHEHIEKINQCTSYEEYTTLVHQYEEYVHKYEVTHKGCHYPKVPAFHGSAHTNVAVVQH
jgi:hypothetical protein